MIRALKKLFTKLDELINIGSMGLFLTLLLMPCLGYSAEEATSTSQNSLGLEVVFFSIIVFITIFLAHIKYDRFSVMYGSEILTTLGILGCFIGIALALWDFDTGNIQRSVPLLLEGIKLAFWSSVAGIGGSLYLRGRQRFGSAPKVDTSENIRAASVEDVVTALHEVKKSLAGDDEGSLLSNIKLMRTESSDNSKKLIDEFRDFSKNMVENNQKAIIEALSKVIEDFNNNLTEQFGENFKQLNLAVEQLVTWQWQYKEELEDIKEAQKQAAQDFNEAAVSFTEVVKQAEKFSEISKSLREQLELASTQKETLYEQELALSELLTTMKNVMPEFSAKANAMLEDVKNGISAIESKTVAIVEDFGMQAKTTNAEIKDQLINAAKQNQEAVSSELKAQLDTIQKAVLTLDEGLTTELNKSLETLGKQLASLSSRFVEDYTPLVMELQKVVQLSKKINNER